MPRPDGREKIVIRYLDGRVEKALALRAMAFNRSAFQAITDGGEVKSYPLAQLKAVFFVKDLVGDASYHEKKELGAGSPRIGYEVKVTFHDGEVIVGRSMNPTFDDHGFYMEPADPRSNNRRLFVVRANVASVEIKPL